jgi:hypothetical protein
LFEILPRKSTRATFDGLIPKIDAEILIEKQRINAICRTVLDRFWQRKTLLLWLQRKYLYTPFLFEDYDALAGRESDESVPYDYDHLCPVDEWGANITRIYNRSPQPALSKENYEALKSYRHVIGNGIGNFQILHYSQNRGAGNASFVEKVERLEEGGWSFEDGVIAIEDRHLWNKTANSSDSGGPPEARKYCWTDDRLMNWQEAVDRRFLRLYELYYDAVSEIVEGPVDGDTGTQEVVGLLVENRPGIVS